jgi:hypothetical protein
MTVSGVARQPTPLDTLHRAPFLYLEAFGGVVPAADGQRDLQGAVLRLHLHGAFVHSWGKPVTRFLSGIKSITTFLFSSENS